MDPAQSLVHVDKCVYLDPQGKEALERSGATCDLIAVRLGTSSWSQKYVKQLFLGLLLKVVGHYVMYLLVPSLN